MITPTIITKLQWAAYLIFMVLNFSLVFLVWFVYPETSNRTLEEMDLLFAASKDENITKDLEKDGQVVVSEEKAKRPWGRSKTVMKSLQWEVKQLSLIHISEPTRPY